MTSPEPKKYSTFSTQELLDMLIQSPRREEKTAIMDELDRRLSAEELFGRSGVRVRYLEEPQYDYEPGQRTVVAVTQFLVQAAIVLLIVTLAAGSLFGYYPWAVFGWMMLGLLITWCVMVLPSCIIAERLYPQPANLKLEVYLLGWLIILAGAGYLLSYISCQVIFDSVSRQKFGPTETTQVITAISGLGLAIGTSIAAIIKAYALLLRARADVMRARASLVSGERRAGVEP